MVHKITRLYIHVCVELSLLERLMTSNELYQRKLTNGEEISAYDNTFVTKLLKNFRSHPAILEVPNQRFYEFELQPWAEKEEREKFCGWQVSDCVINFRQMSK